MITRLLALVEIDREELKDWKWWRGEIIHPILVGLFEHLILSPAGLIVVICAFIFLVAYFSR